MSKLQTIVRRHRYNPYTPPAQTCARLEVIETRTIEVEIKVKETVQRGILPL